MINRVISRCFFYSCHCRSFVVACLAFNCVNIIFLSLFCIFNRKSAKTHWAAAVELRDDLIPFLISRISAKVHFSVFQTTHKPLDRRALRHNRPVSLLFMIQAEKFVICAKISSNFRFYFQLSSRQRVCMSRELWKPLHGDLDSTSSLVIDVFGQLMAEMAASEQQQWSTHKFSISISVINNTFISTEPRPVPALSPAVGRHERSLTSQWSLLVRA